MSTTHLLAFLVGLAVSYLIGLITVAIHLSQRRALKRLQANTDNDGAGEEPLGGHHKHVQ